MVECSEELKSKAMKQLSALKSTLASEGVDLNEFIEEYGSGESEDDSEGMEMSEGESEMESSEDEGEAPKSNPKKAALIIAMLKKKKGSE